MQKLLKALKNKAGETLTETLAAVLIISIISAGFVALIDSAEKLNIQAKNSNRDLYEQVTKVEKHQNSGGGKVVFSVGSESESVTVTYYTDDDGSFYLYEAGN